MASLIFDEAPPSELPTMVVAFAGWPDAAEAASRAIRYMVRKLPAKRFATIDPEEFYDFTVQRPQTRMNRRGDRAIRWPSNDFYRYTPEGNPERSLLLYVGTEPNLRWRTFSNMIVDLANQCGVKLIVTLGALLDAVPHTREPRITGRASSSELSQKAEWLGIRHSGYQGPTGIHSAFSDACKINGIPHANIWTHCPHYVQTSPNPLASLALLNRLQNLVDFEVDVEELRLAGEAFEAEITKAISKQPDVSSYVTRLENRYDEDNMPIEDIPNPGDMVEELEAYLRSQRGRSELGT